MLSGLNFLDELKHVRFDSKFMYPLHLVWQSPILVPPTPIGHTESRLLLPFRQCSAHSHIQYRALPILTCQTESKLLPPVRQSPAHSYLSDSIPHLLSPFLTVLPTPTPTLIQSPANKLTCQRASWPVSNLPFNFCPHSPFKYCSSHSNPSYRVPPNPNCHRVSPTLIFQTASHPNLSVLDPPIPTCRTESHPLPPLIESHPLIFHPTQSCPF